MPKPTKGPRLGGTPAHQRIILNNLASQLFEHGRLTTTEAKAKRVQPLAETLITKAKRGDLHARRLVLKAVTDQSVVHTLFTEIAPSFADREGGYTRITKVGNRKGDNAPMAVIELVRESVEDGRRNKPARSAQATTSAAPAAGATAASAAPAEVEVPAQASDAATSDPDAPAEVTDPAQGAEPAEGSADPAVTEDVTNA